MDKDQIQKISYFFKKYSNHSISKFYLDILNIKDVNEDALLNISKNERNKTILVHALYLIDDVFKESINPVLLEDEFLVLTEDSNLIEFTNDYDFSKNSYKIYLIKNTKNIIKDLNDVSFEISKIKERLQLKKLVLDIIETVSSHDRISFRLSLGVHKYEPMITTINDHSGSTASNYSNSDMETLRYIMQNNDGIYRPRDRYNRYNRKGSSLLDLMGGVDNRYFDI